MTFDADRFLADREGNTETVRIVMRSGLVSEISRLQDELKSARRLDESENRIPEAPTILEMIEELRTEMEASSQEFTFGELPRHEYEALIAGHTPRKVDRDNGAVWNAETFPPALIAAASTSPKLSAGDARKLWEHLPFGEARRLFLAAVAPQGKVAAVPLAVSGIGSTPTTATNSTTPLPEESLEASS